jgi:hypothetical protein
MFTLPLILHLSKYEATSGQVDPRLPTSDFQLRSFPQQRGPLNFNPRRSSSSGHDYYSDETDPRAGEYRYQVSVQFGGIGYSPTDTSHDSFDLSHMITVRVGKELDHKDFIAPESFLTSRSEFFRRAMNGKWAESESRVVKLPEDKPDVFAIYVNLIYTGHLPTMLKSKEELAGLDHKTLRSFTCPEYDSLLCLYVLAEKLQDIAAKGTALAAVFEVSQLTDATGRTSIPHPTAVLFTYENTLKGSPARSLVTDLWSAVSLPCLLMVTQVVRFPKDFLSDLGKVLQEQRPLLKGSGNLASRRGAEAYMESLPEILVTSAPKSA